MLVGLIRAYQAAFSPLLPPSCRFTPSCSSYAVTAVRRFGAVRGAWLAVRRLLRCHPFGRFGFDPVPDFSETRCSRSGQGSRGAGVAEAERDAAERDAAG